MIKDKYIPHLAIGAMLLMLILVAVGYGVNFKYGSENASIEQPEYMTKLFDKNEVLEINIQIDETSWETLKENAAAEEYYQADITINGEKYPSVGIRAKGNSSLSMVASDDTTDRYSFKVKLDEYVTGQNAYGLEKFVLNNMIGDTTYMKEYLSYDMFTEMGIPTPGFAFAHITINGEEWGLYLACEALEESFAERSFGTLDGNLYKVESDNMGGGGGQGNGGQKPAGEPRAGNPGNDGPVIPTGEGQGLEGEPPVGDTSNGAPPARPAEEDKSTVPVLQESTDADVKDKDATANSRDKFGQRGGMGSSSGTNLVYTDDEISSYSGIFNYSIFKTTTTEDYYTMINILKNLNEGTNLEESIDVEEVLRYFAVNTFLVNLDSYASSMKHNFYLYEEDGKLQIIPWDYNLSFAAFQTESASKAINFPIDAPVTDSMENSPLISKLLEVDEYKALYHDYLQELIDLYITSGKYEQMINDLDALIGEYVKNDATAFFTYDEYVASLPELLQFGIDRAKSIAAQLAGEQPSDSYGNISTTVNLTAMGTQNGNKGGGGPNKAGQGNVETNQGNEQTGINSADTNQSNAQMDPNGVEPSQGNIEINQGNNGNMPQGMPDNMSKENIQEVMSLMEQTSENGELTDEAKTQLIALGIEESQIEELQAMSKNFQGGARGMSGPGEVAVDQAAVKMKLIGSLGTLIVGIIIVLCFKRKKFRSK